ncbi:hypothetical protein DRB07_03950 [Actinomyces sp. Z3]|nr:hypothetical protein DRB07_03950 [Actinomyces sp. Z3]
MTGRAPGCRRAGEVGAKAWRGRRERPEARGPRMVAEPQPLPPPARFVIRRPRRPGRRWRRRRR